jgi:adenylate kinase
MILTIIAVIVICSAINGLKSANHIFLQSQPVEEFYRSRGKLLEFDLPGGIPESWPKLLEALNLDQEDKCSAAA